MDKYITRAEVIELLREIRQEILRLQQPPQYVILDETDMCDVLHISKRHSADLRKEGKIEHSKDGGKLYYKLSWLLEYVDRFKVELPKNSIINKYKDK